MKCVHVYSYIFTYHIRTHIHTDTHIHIPSSLSFFLTLRLAHQVIQRALYLYQSELGVS